MGSVSSNWPSQGGCKNIPLWPLARAFRQMSAQQVAQYLPQLSEQQRMACLDLDLWRKDDLNSQEFAFWIDVYHRVSSWELKLQFLQSEQFALYFKGVMNVSTFDEEEPQYPAHNNFFLTDDHLLLIEYGESFSFVDELQALLSVFYSHLGVEEAYAHLFKITVDSFPIFQEEQYRLKKDRLRDYGLIDYYDALEMLAPMGTMARIKNFIACKKQTKGSIDSELKNQVPPQQMLAAYRQGFTSIRKEVAKVEDRERIDFLHFNFLRLISASLALEEASKKTRDLLSLGLDYLKSVRHFEGSAFDLFDFVEVYRIGRSLIHSHSSLLERSLAKNGMNSPQKEAFIGRYLQSILEDSAPLDLKGFERWSSDLKLLIDLLPFIARFYQSYERIVGQGLLQDNYYLNYRVAEIDFEALILSNLINFDLGHYDSRDHQPKIGLSVSELKTFSKKYFYQEKPHQLKRDQMQPTVQQFLDNFGPQQIANIDHYLFQLLDDHLAGHDFWGMPEQEFAHVGGPIIYGLCQ